MSSSQCIGKLPPSRANTSLPAAPKQPVKGLPASIDVPADATFEDLKKLIAKTTKAGDFNRVGIFDPETRKTVKNRNARLVDQPGIAKTNEVLVKDLGAYPSVAQYQGVP